MLIVLATGRRGRPQWGQQVLQRCLRLPVSVQAAVGPVMQLLVGGGQETQDGAGHPLSILVADLSPCLQQAQLFGLHLDYLFR